jgi:hypothetical protein
MSTNQDKGLSDVARDAADKARDAADKAREAAVKAKDKFTEVVGDNEDKIVNAIERTGSFVDEKITKGRFTDKIDKAQDVAKSAVGKIAAAGGSGDGDGGAAGGPGGEGGPSGGGPAGGPGDEPTSGPGGPGQP